MNTFAHCLCYLSALDLVQQGVFHLPTGHPARLKSTSQMYSHGKHLDANVFFPFSAIILHFPKILPILSKKQEGLAMLAALNLCLQNTFKAKTKQIQL